LNKPKLKIILCDTAYSPQLEEFAHNILRGYENVEILNLPHAPKGQELGRTLTDAYAVTLDVSTGPLTPEIIDRMKNCKLIVTLSTGYDHISLEAASRKGIYVCNVADYCIEEVADHTLGFIITVSRKMHRLSKLGADFESYQKVGLIHRLRGRTLGLIGVGKIGKAVAARAKAFGLEVIAYDPYVPETSLSGIRLVGLNELLRRSDIISIHSLLTEETRHMISTEQFRMMKDGVYVINCGRGGIIDHDPFIDALKSGKVGGAGVDVYEKEPPDPTDPLLHMEQVFATPHTAFNSVEADMDRQRIPIEQIARVLNHKPPNSIVNLTLLKQMGLCSTIHSHMRVVASRSLCEC
jgi:D-3-phosphoglycerate dehydrogenase